jgi:hypothetical protein
MQLRDSYDLIVIGDQLSGFFLAAGAAQEGKRVLVLEESSSSHLLHEIPSGRFLGDFACEPFLGLQSGSAIDLFLKSLGLYQNLDDLFPAHLPPLQFVDDAVRMDFSYQPESLKAEIFREFSTQQEEISRLIAGLVLENGSFPAAVQKLGLPVSYEKFGWLQAALVGSICDRQLPYPQYKKILQMAALGLRFPMGGRDALKERLQSRIQIHEGRIRRNTRVEEIVFEKGRLAGVLLSSYEGFIRSPMVIGAMASENFFALVPKQLQSNKVSNWQLAKKPTHWRLQFCLTVQENSLPEGLGTHVCIPLDDTILQLQTFPREIYGGLPANQRTINVRVLIPYRETEITTTAIARTMKRALQRISHFCPFLKVEKVSPDPSDLAKDPIFQRYYQFPGLEHIPPLYLVYDSSSFSSSVDLLDGEKFGISGLGLCSRDIYPLLGSTGEILAAMELLAIIRRRAEKRK